MYSWLSEQLRAEFEEVPWGSVRLIRHLAAGTQFILRTYTHTTRQQQNRAAETLGNLMAQVM